LDAALRLLPMIIAMSAVMPLSGYLMPKIGRLKWWPIAGTSIALPGFVYMGKIKKLSKNCPGAISNLK